MKTFLLIILSVLLINSSFSQTPINPANIDIVRDSFGVPHIFAKTDAEVAYGLAWAEAEDDFKSMPVKKSNGLIVGHQCGKGGRTVTRMAHSRIPTVLKYIGRADSVVVSTSTSHISSINPFQLLRKIERLSPCAVR